MRPRGMGRFWGFQEAWLSLAGSVFDVAIYPTLFVSYLGHLLPWTTAGVRGPMLAVALVAAAAAWNLLGAKSVGDSCVAMGLAVLTVYGFFHRGAPAASATPLANIDLLGGILVALWNYMGWDYASTVADEVDRPQRTFPLAMAGAVALVALTYVLPIAAVAFTGLDPNHWSTGGWADVAKAVIPSIRATMMELTTPNPRARTAPINDQKTPWANRTESGEARKLSQIGCKIRGDALSIQMPIRSVMSSN